MVGAHQGDSHQHNNSFIKSFPVLQTGLEPARSSLTKGF